jgi:transcriptional antiterminator RfaH
MAYWCVGQTEPRHESAAAHFLRLAGYRVFLPRLRQVRARGGRKVESHIPLFPSYLFISITNGWWSARWAPHMARLLTAGDAPMPVPDALVDDLVARTRDGAIDVLRRPSLKPGDPLRVVAGPFRDQIAELVSLRPRQRVEVLLRILGAQQKVELPRDVVEAIRSD